MSRRILAAFMMPVYSVAFVAMKTLVNVHSPIAVSAVPARASELIIPGDLLSDLPTPSLLIELSLAEGTIDSDSSISFEDILNDPTKNNLLNGSVFVHTQITDTSVRDAITQQQGSGKSHIICQVDVSPKLIPAGAYLGIGLANHLVGGYYWARGLGMGASLPAHGVFLSSYDDESENEEHGELYWKKRGPGRDAKENTEESSNSNDGKRSEWADFVMVGDTVQLVPENATEVLSSSHFSTLLGVRRIGRPLGADPIVEKIWARSKSSDKWTIQ